MSVVWTTVPAGVGTAPPRSKLQLPTTRAAETGLPLACSTTCPSKGPRSSPGRTVSGRSGNGAWAWAPAQATRRHASPGKAAQGCLIRAGVVGTLIGLLSLRFYPSNEGL